MPDNEAKFKYVVVENAGYTKERDIKSFTSFDGAQKFMTAQYEADEIENLHVAIAADLPNGDRTYEI